MGSDGATNEGARIGTVYVNGAFVAPALGRTATLVDPSTEQVLGTAAIGTAEDVEAAVAADLAVRAAWSALTFAERADVLDRFVDACLARAEEMAVSVSR